VKELIAGRARRPSNILFASALIVVAVATRFPERSTTFIAFLITAVALAVAAVMYKAVRLPRTRVDHVSDVVFVLFETYVLADAVSQHSRDHGDLVLSAILLLFLVIPLPLTVILWRRRQDEFQRSLAVSSGAIAFGAMLIGSIAYSLLQRVDHLGALTPIAFAIAGSVMWFVTWIVLRIRAG